MGRPRKYPLVPEATAPETPAPGYVGNDPLVIVSRTPRDQLPTLLAKAKRDGDVDLVAAILEACS